MRPTVSKHAIVALVLAGVPLVAPSETRADGPCVRAFPEARYSGVGFNHIVHLVNACAATAECTVSTDVNPEPQTVVVAGRSQAEVNTFLGSPARVFVPNVTCRMRDR